MLQGTLLRLQFQLPPSLIAPNISISEAAMAQGGVISPAGAEQPLNKVMSTTQSTEAHFISTEWLYMHFCNAGRTLFFQVLFLAACYYCEHFPRKPLTEIAKKALTLGPPASLPSRDTTAILFLFRHPTLLHFCRIMRRTKIW